MKQTKGRINEAALVLIDTWWNVNATWFHDGTRQGIVLIDTWWNVNEINSSGMIIECRVLIDTWWNVNTEQVKSSKKVSSF